MINIPYKYLKAPLDHNFMGWNCKGVFGDYKTSEVEAKTAALFTAPL